MTNASEKWTRLFALVLAAAAILFALTQIGGF